MYLFTYVLSKKYVVSTLYVEQNKRSDYQNEKKM